MIAAAMLTSSAPIAPGSKLARRPTLGVYPRQRRTQSRPTRAQPFAARRQEPNDHPLRADAHGTGGRIRRQGGENARDARLAGSAYLAVVGDRRRLGASPLAEEGR